jgi:hypothetical protein
MFCYADPNPLFQPAMRLITSITKAFWALVTTTFDHQYKTGLIIRLYIPISCGMYQADGYVGQIVVTSTDTFTIDLNTIEFDDFAVPAFGTVPDFIDTCAQVIPVGEGTDFTDSSTYNSRTPLFS